MKDDPVNETEPPLEAEYHLIEPVPVAVSVTVPVEHLATSLATGAAGAELIFAVTGTLALLHPVPASA